MSTWQDLVTASLIGTERAEVPRPGIPGLPPVDDGACGDPAALLLGQAALLTAARRAGRRPDHAEPLAKAAPDPRPAVSQAAASRLMRMLGGEHPDLLVEWLTAVVARGQRVPARLLPALLDWVRPHAPRRLVAEAAGSRARWLAWLNPAWQFVLVETPAGDDAWRVGTTADRCGYLADLRARDPGAAAGLVAGSWDLAGAGERAMFLDVLAKSIGPDDEPLLEAALDDRAEEVRGRARHLLAGLPGSALGRRMAERAAGRLRVEGDVPGLRLAVFPPTETDAGMRRDGIPPGPPGGRSGPADWARLMLEMVALTPLGTWTRELGLPAARIVSVPAGPWTPVLFIGWSRAAVGQGDAEWTAALINRALTSLPAPADPSRYSPAELQPLWHLARRADPSLGAPGALAEPGPDTPQAVRDAIGVLRFRYDMLKELDHDHSAS